MGISVHFARTSNRHFCLRVFWRRRSLPGLLVLFWHLVPFIFWVSDQSVSYLWRLSSYNLNSTFLKLNMLWFRSISLTFFLVHPSVGLQGLFFSSFIILLSSLSSSSSYFVLLNPLAFDFYHYCHFWISILIIMFFTFIISSFSVSLFWSYFIMSFCSHFHLRHCISSTQLSFRPFRHYFLFIIAFHLPSCLFDPLVIISSSSLHFIYPVAYE